MSLVADNLSAATKTRRNLRAEFDALASNCAVYPLASRAKISLGGGDRTRWLNGMITNNIRDLSQGRGVYAFLLNPQGHILGDLYAYNRGEDILLDIDQFQLPKILSTFDHYIIMDDVEVVDVSGKLAAIGIAGPQSRKTLQSAGFDVSALEPLQFVAVNWRNSPSTLVRSDSPAVESYELWLDPAQSAEAQKSLVAAGAQPVGAEAQELLRIASGIPRYGQDIRERDLPQETSQQRALHFSKGCYIGQEIVERIRSRGAVHRVFTGFLAHGDLPVPGPAIQIDGKDVGEITSSAVIPIGTQDVSVALGYLRREAALPGKTLLAAGAKLTIAPLPFAPVFPRSATEE
ncbi:MAG TPA: folate-binding protein [Terriglobales bacterium]